MQTMASSIDKHKKSNKDTTSSSMYVYKFGGIGSRTPEYYATAAAAAKKSKGWGHILRRSSKNSKKDTLHHEGVQEKDIKEVVVEGAGIKLAHDSGFFDQGRKSLSSLDVKLGRNYVEGRKSISHQQIPGKNYSNDSNNNNNNNNNTKAGVIGGMRKKSVYDDDHHRRHHVPENHEGKLKPSSISTQHVDRILTSLSKSSDDVLGRKYAEGRRSVSHVEDNRAYVGSRYTDAVADRDHEASKGGRKSVSGVEGLKSEIGLLQVRVLVTDMPAFMQIHAFRCARRTFDSLETFSAKHMAYNLKKEFDKVYGPAWHCIVGSSFGSFVTHSTGCFLYFSMEKLYILLFKTKVQKALE